MSTTSVVPLGGNGRIRGSIRISTSGRPRFRPSHVSTSFLIQSPAVVVSPPWRSTKVGDTVYTARAARPSSSTVPRKLVMARFDPWTTSVASFPSTSTSFPASSASTRGRQQRIASFSAFLSTVLPGKHSTTFVQPTGSPFTSWRTNPPGGFPRASEIPGNDPTTSFGR